MAGKETTGVLSADADLFQDRTWIFAHHSAQVLSADVSQSFLRWIQLCGAVYIFLSASEHDRIVAWTSHLPQLISTVLAASLYEQLPLDQLVTLSGPGLRDTTRLGGSSWTVWADIIKSNTDSIQHVLSVYIDRLTEMRHNLQTQRTSEEFAVAAEVARAIRRGVRTVR
jgi:prephenate dehydrogenase